MDDFEVSRARAPSWEDVFNNYPIFERIFTYLGPGGIMALRATTKQLVHTIDMLSKVQWNINRSLKRFVNDPVRFRSLMARHEALISGSFALQFFGRIVWKDSDLDIYHEAPGLGKENGTKALAQHLMKNEGYTIAGNKTIPGCNHYANHTDFIERVTTLTRGNDESDENKIQLIATKAPPIEMILTSFYTTAVVNIISWDCAYSIFPDVTFLKKKTYQLKPLSNYYGFLLTKYHRRGWVCLQVPRNDDGKWTSSLQTYASRRVGDSKCWKMKLDTTDVEPGPPSSVLELPFITSKTYDYDTKSFEVQLLQKL